MIELVIALGAGLISFLSPCVLPLIPGYISYISGSSLNEIIEKKYKFNSNNFVYYWIFNSLYNFWCCINFFRSNVTTKFK